MAGMASGRRGGAADFADFLRALFDAQDDDVVDVRQANGVFEIEQRTWKLMAGLTDYHPACARMLEGLVEGLAAGCGRHIPVRMSTPSTAAAPLVWAIG